MSRNRPSQTIRTLAVLVLLALGGVSGGFAQPSIPADPFSTVAAPFPEGTHIDFGTGVVPPVPADFFGPGSDPFDGVISFTGDPLSPPDLGDASTLVLRSDHPVPPEAPPGSSGAVDIEIVELSLVSVQPILVTYNGGLDPEPWEVWVQLSPTIPPPGQLMATKTHENGGFFDMTFFVQPLFVFTRVDDGYQLLLDTAAMGMYPLEFVGAGPWVHQLNPDLGYLAPSDGWFVPGVEEMVPGYPESQQGNQISAVELSGAAQHTVFPAFPPAPPDPLATISGQEPDGSFVHFGSGAIPPLPADFFGPGSDPFEGQVALDGQPLDPPLLGDASTQAQRSGHPVPPQDPPGAAGEVPIEIVALDLVSVEPIIVTYNGGQDPEAWDVRVGLSGSIPDAGTLLAIKTHQNGGTFDAYFAVQPLFVFTRVMDGQQVSLDTADVGMPPLQFGLLGAPWVHQLSPILDIIAPSAPFFVPGVEEMVPGDPLTQEPRRMYAEEMTGAARHTIFPARAQGTAVPEAVAAPLEVRSYPNPFNPCLRIEFTLPRGGRVGIWICDLTGRLVNRLADDRFGPGTHAVRWDGTDLNGGSVASGVYLYRISAPGATTSGKVSLVR